MLQRDGAEQTGFSFGKLRASSSVTSVDHRTATGGPCSRASSAVLVLQNRPSMSSHTFWLCVALALLVQVAARPDAALKSDFFFPKHHGLSVIIRKGPATVAATTSSQNGKCPPGSDAGWTYLQHHDSSCTSVGVTAFPFTGSRGPSYSVPD